MLDLADIADVVADAVREATVPLLARLDELEKRELPAPLKGEKGDKGDSVDMEEVEARIDMAVKSAVNALPAPKDGKRGDDGIGLADALKDAEGNLILVMTDGRTKSLGRVDGKDGEPGLGFEHMSVEQINERTVRFLFKRDAEEAEVDITFPLPIYRGVFKEGEAYEPGDLTTWAGSLWHLNEAKGLKPGAPDSGWQLAAKAGRPGKDAK